MYDDDDDEGHSENDDDVNSLMKMKIARCYCISIVKQGGGDSALSISLSE